MTIPDPYLVDSYPDDVYPDEVTATASAMARLSHALNPARDGNAVESLERIATALEGLLLVLDTRGEVSGYLTRNTR